MGEQCFVLHGGHVLCAGSHLWLLRDLGASAWVNNGDQLLWGASCALAGALWASSHGNLQRSLR